MSLSSTTNPAHLQMPGFNVALNATPAALNSGLKMIGGFPNGLDEAHLEYGSVE
ncbi:unnamed protein product [Penicillium manginii]